MLKVIRIEDAIVKACEETANYSESSDYISN